MASVNEQIESRLTRHQIDLQRLSNGTVRRILSVLQKSDSRVVNRLARDDVSQLSRTRMETMLRDLRRIIDSSYVDATGALQIELNALAVYEGEFLDDLFGKVIPVKMETVTPSPEQIVAAANNRPFQGKLLKEVYQELPASTFRQVRDTIRNGFVEGRTTDQIVRDIRGRASQGYRDGILAKSKRNVETVVRTAVNHTSNAAREYTYEANDDLIKGVRWVSTLDARTSAVCQARDGKVYEPGKGPRPPAHFNCRSSTSPVLKSWQELGFDVDELPEGTRASMNGQVPAGQDYDAWLRKQPREFQDEVLGKTKGDLFRNGTKLDRFVDASGREYTLDELRQREGVKPRASAKPKQAAPDFAYKRFSGIKSVADAENYLKENGIAEDADLKGISPKGLSKAVGAAHEVTERFGLKPLAYMGPITRDTRYRYRRVQSANAAVFPSTNAMHLPTKFGDLKDAQKQIERKAVTSKQYELERQALLAASVTDEEVKRRVKQMKPGEYSWTITAKDAASERAKTMYHEFGHVLHLIDEGLGKKINEALTETKAFRGQWGLLLSKYATSNPAELVAESFAHYMTAPKSEHYRIHPRLLEIFREADREYVD